ncbi:MAG TPA: hypothetical protein VFQ88_14130 [Nevskiaceae bacterium]|nr:hypothetical protein [Nevskiaceae bacterium]
MDRKIITAICADDQRLTTDQLASKYASEGGEHPVFDREDWNYEVHDHDTGLGYWEWVSHRIESYMDDIGTDA